MSGKKEINGKGGEEVTVKLSGDTLKQLISVRGAREADTGRITSIAELVREAIACWVGEEVGVSK